MDFNQSPVSGYQSNKIQSSRPASEFTSVTEASKPESATVSSSPSPLAATPAFKEGQQIKGRIIDLRFNTAKIQLEPGKQVITAKLSSDIPLSIGDDAKFTVATEATDLLVLKYISEGEASATDATIQKALAASSLPMTERNKALVTELLNHRMPIDKQTLMSMIKALNTNPGASALTLVLMQQNRIPFTSSNIRQFEAYQKGTHQLMNDIQTITRNISSLLKPVTGFSETAFISAGPASSIGESAFTLDTSATGAAALTLDTSATGAAVLTLDTSATGAAVSGEPLPTIALSQGLPTDAPGSTLTDHPAFEHSSFTKDALLSASSTPPSDSVSESYPALKQVLQMNGKLIDILLDAVKAPDQASSTPQLQPAFTDNPLKLSDFMNTAERTLLQQYLPEQTDPSLPNDSITQGTASLKDTLLFLQTQLSKSDPGTALKLLQSPAYSKLLKEAFLQKWTITPEKVSGKAKVSGLYNQLKEDLEQLSLLTKAGAANVERSHLQEPVRNLQENLQFIKDLNQAFTYLQLPVQLKDQNTSADLYVFSRKGTANDRKEKLSVLLHLDMSNLGSISIYLLMNQGRRIQADFYTEVAQTGQLIRENLSTLTYALDQKGYSLMAEVKEDYKKTDFCRDFIEQNQQGSDFRRYSFDIRT